MVINGTAIIARMCKSAVLNAIGEMLCVLFSVLLTDENIGALFEINKNLY